MNKRDLKKLTKARKQMVNEYEGPIESHQIDEDFQNLKGPHLLHQYLSILTITYSKPKTKALKNSKSLAYKADQIRNSKVSRMNPKLKSFKNWTMLKRYITYFKN